MNPEDVDEAVSWAEREGWQPGLGDGAAFFAADPDGFFRSVEGERTVATISVVHGSPRVAFVGLYIVDPEYRGLGHGKALWDEALSRFDGLTLGLDAVPEQVGTYASDGFVPAYGNARYTGEATSLPAPDPTIDIQLASRARFEDLVGFDAARHFGPRPGFLREWVAGDGREAIITVDDQRITGFAASRRTTNGHRIGPVFAERTDLAEALILDLAARIEGPVSIDLPQPNRAAVELLTALGMSRSFETTRMYRGQPPALPLDQIYGITSLELG
jgi:GNAT superfamily N-acetyltransferase